MNSEDNETIKTLFQHQHGYVISKVMFTASELGIFDLLLESEEPLTAPTIAEHLGTSLGGMERLLGACVSLKLLKMERKDNTGLYENTNLANLCLAKASPKSQYNYMKLYSEAFYPLFQDLPDVVRKGQRLCKPSKTVYESLYRSEENQQIFNSAMDEVWRLHGRDVISAFDFSRFPVIYDLGGGNGALAKECISLYPNSTITIFDLPEVVEKAKKHFVCSEDRIIFQEGNFFKDPVPEADLYILSRVLCDWDDEKCVQLLTKLHKTCKPGGGVLLVQMVLDEDRCGPLQVHLLSIIMLLLTDGKERTLSECSALFSKSGFKDVEFKKGSRYDVVFGRK
ncbi:acetylserotonin O-methyltransferase-like [Sceloporus undulatus]|uniref:acetylserotonin O-methyltransferase-like n=1 Tax=Sceloporus undulatus TaxID=8520 RepID=UPI001C4D7B81|nr:acetylserotonin O-methyltransferase-like [Sceloporus undulatus]